MCFISRKHKLTCIIYQDVQTLLLLQKLLTKVSNGAQVGQIQLHIEDIKRSTVKFDLSHGRLSLFRVSASNDDTGASRCQGNSCLLASTRVASYTKKNMLPSLFHLKNFKLITKRDPVFISTIHLASETNG